nr:proton myo-inositol cotransporter [Cavia porcellus]
MFHPFGISGNGEGGRAVSVTATGERGSESFRINSLCKARARPTLMPECERGPGSGLNRVGSAAPARQARGERLGRQCEAAARGAIFSSARAGPASGEAAPPSPAPGPLALMSRKASREWRKYTLRSLGSPDGPSGAGKQPEPRRGEQLREAHIGECTGPGQGPRWAAGHLSLRGGERRSPVYRDGADPVRLELPSASPSAQRSASTLRERLRTQSPASVQVTSSQFVEFSIASMTVPVYIAEVSPPNLRGRLVTINTLFITGGQFFASVVDGAFSYLQKDGWRYMLGLAAIPAVIQFFGFLFLPESPRWLIQKGQTQKARRILSQMRGNQTIDEEYDSIKNNIEEEEKEIGSAGPVICRMLTYPPTRRALIVGCGLQMFQQLSGINTIMYYSATILQMSGVEDDRLAIWLASVTAFTNFIFTLVGVWLVEKVGRRKLTFGSLAGTTVALIILALGFLLSAQVSPHITFKPVAPSGQNATCTRYSYCNECMLDPNCGFCYKMNKSAVIDSSCVPVNKASTTEAAWGRCENETKFKTDEVFWAYNFCPTPYSWTALLGLILYLVFFAPGMGPMPWTVNSEIYPLWARSTGNACSSGINWIFNVLVSLTFLHTAEYLTYYGAFFLYAGFAAVGLLFVYGCLPETKGKKLEEIESLFDNRLCTCGTSDSDEGRYIEYIRVKGSNYHLSDNDASDVE